MLPYMKWISLYLRWPSGLLVWWIFVVPVVGLILVFLSIFFRTSRTDECRHCTKHMIIRLFVCSCLNSYCTFHLFPPLIFFFKLVASCTEFNLLTPFYVALYDNGSPYIYLKTTYFPPNFVVAARILSKKFSRRWGF